MWIKNIKTIIEMESAIKNAYEEMKSLPYDEEFMRIYQMREKAVADFNSDMDYARCEARQEGIAIGERQGIMETIKLLKEGKSVEEISRLFNVNLK
jgi:predicted transposase/invertase (TIGR01784 family)